MKFSVAPESRSAVVLALFWDRWMNRCSCIDFHMEKYIQSDPILLIQATWIRPPKNFLPELPAWSSTLPDCLLGAHSIVGRWCLLPWCRSCFHCLLDSSRWVVWCTYWCVSVWWGNCKQSALALHNWNTHPVSLVGFEHHWLWLRSLSVNLILSLSNFLLVPWFNRDPLEPVDYSMTLAL